MRILFLGLAALFFSSYPATADDVLDHNQLYFFTYDGCPYCRTADEYISKTYPDLALKKVDIHKPGGLFLFKKCAEKFKLGRQVGTPLFCAGDSYLMGWSEENQKKFDNLAQQFSR